MESHCTLNRFPVCVRGGVLCIAFGFTYMVVTGVDCRRPVTVRKGDTSETLL